MLRCLELAKLGEGHTSPNPMVGCVIVYEDKIIGEGFHQRYGDPHAEVNAIRSVKDSSLLQHSTLYVSLEPCSHYGKTPPCSDLIIGKKIPHVVIATTDPNPEVSGRGIQKLQLAGCCTEVGILEHESRELNRRFFTFFNKKRPYIILKWAQTTDGFIDSARYAGEEAKPTWITSETTRVTVHKQRSTENAILIGTETAIKDNPSLTLRDWFGNQPSRIVVDIKNRLPEESKLFNGEAQTYTVSAEAYADNRKTILIQVSSRDYIPTLLNFLFESNIQSLIVEGGTKTLNYFLETGFWDEAHVYTGNKQFGDGVNAPDFNSSILFSEKFHESKLDVYRNLSAR